MLNVPLLRKTLEHITAHPKEHDQEIWALRLPSCGTKGCVAYHAAIMEGDLQAISSFDGLIWHIEDHNGKRVGSIQRVAQDRLGLNDWQAGVLFESNNTVSRLWQLAHKFSSGEIEIPPEFATP